MKILYHYVCVALVWMQWSSAYVHGKNWIPQLGTVSHPKLSALSPHAQKWDVYRLDDGELHQAKKTGQITELTETDMWELLPYGSFKNPKDASKDQIVSEGEMFIDHATGKYFNSICVAREGDVLDKRRSECLKEVNIYADWMGLMKSSIEDTRLGDLAIPATHDTATSGINEDSYLVDQNFLFRLGDLVVPEAIVNWSLTQDLDIGTQLEGGFRQFDLRVADCRSFNDTFRWWHGLSADVIDEGLQQIATFAKEHPDEVLMLDFQNFVRPTATGTDEMLQGRKRDVNDIILSYLSDVLVPYVNMDRNPTYGEVLATGGNVIAIMQDNDINGMSDLYWPNSMLIASWSGRTNPEELFLQRSEGLRNYLQNHADQMTELSGALTPDEVTIAAAMYRVYGDGPIFSEILERLLPGSSNLDADRMSFEGVFVDLLYTARYGTNTNGMKVRDGRHYSNGASVHYRGINDMYRHWLARPGEYKANILYLDDGAVSSDIVSTAVLANLKEIPREASITLQGNTRTGFYFWDNFTAYGGEEGLECETVQARFIIQSRDYRLFEIVNTVFEFVMQEGFYPLDTTVEVFVNSLGDSEAWFTLGSFNIQTLIEANMDMYIRGDNTGGGGGFAYLSEQYNLYGESCGTPPDPSGENIIDFVQW